MSYGIGRGSLALAAMLWAFTLAPLAMSPQAMAEEPTMKTGAGDVSLPRSEQEMAVAFKAHGILLKALMKRDAQNLLAAARLMGQLSDPLGVSDMETSFAAAMTMRPALANSSNASSNRVVVLEAEDVLLMALQIAEGEGTRPSPPTSAPSRKFWPIGPRRPRPRPSAKRASTAIAAAITAAGTAVSGGRREALRKGRRSSFSRKFAARRLSAGLGLLHHSAASGRGRCCDPGGLPWRAKAGPASPCRLGALSLRDAFQRARRLRYLSR